VLIGEIRDRETAEIAIQASLTGHLVLSTLHTNDAPSAVTRLIDIGVASYKIATAVKGVLAQRLVRRTCAACHGISASACTECGGTGFRGRLALVEVLVGSLEFEQRVAAGESTERIAEAARANGMRTLWKSGLVHAAAGRTTVEEVLRVATPDDEPRVVSEPPPPLPVVAAASEPVFNGAAFTLRDDLDTCLTSTRPRHRRRSFEGMATIEIGTVDVFVISPRPEGWRVLALQRALQTRCPGAWEPVHGHIDPGEEPEDAAVREVREESGLHVDRLYNVRVQPFYLHKTHTLQMAIVFAAFVDDPEPVVIGPEHQAAEWLSVDGALRAYGFPAERESLRSVVELLSNGDAGAVDDVMRIF
jgi:8-oxo-dGTP pyrophosphatase MutT (NUDIX family)